MVKLRLYEGTGDIKIKAPEGNFNILFFESLSHRLNFIRLDWSYFIHLYIFLFV